MICRENGLPNRMHAEPPLDGRWLAMHRRAWRWAGRWLCGGGLPMGVAHRARIGGARSARHGRLPQRGAAPLERGAAQIRWLEVSEEEK